MPKSIENVPVPFAPFVMNRLTAIVVGFLSLLMAGCFQGDPIAQRAVVLDMSVSQHQATSPLSATDPNVQEALRIIDDAFVTKGFTRDKHPPLAQEQAQGMIASYGRYTVNIKDHRLIVSFVEFGKRHTSLIVEQTCALMKEKLTSRFGPQHVRVETGSSWIGLK